MGDLFMFDIRKKRSAPKLTIGGKKSNKTVGMTT